jgi:hypothetical protein
MRRGRPKRRLLDRNNAIGLGVQYPMTAGVVRPGEQMRKTTFQQPRLLQVQTSLEQGGVATERTSMVQQRAGVGCP